MPEHDGYDFMRWVRRLRAEDGGRTPAAAFTAFARAEDRKRALAVGFQAHLVKPVEPGDTDRRRGRTGPGRALARGAARPARS